MHWGLNKMAAISQTTFSIAFLDRNDLCRNSNFTENYSYGSNKKNKVSIGSGNYLTPNRRHAITRINVDLVHWCIARPPWVKSIGFVTSQPSRFIQIRESYHMLVVSIMKSREVSKPRDEIFTYIALNFGSRLDNNAAETTIKIDGEWENQNTNLMASQTRRSYDKTSYRILEQPLSLPPEENYEGDNTWLEVVYSRVKISSR